MSTPIPQSNSGYASPAPLLHASTFGPAGSSSKPAAPRPKPTNVFSNDGSFLERFQRIQKDEEEKKKQEEILAKKRNFDNRFKQRGKRPSPDSSNSKNTAADPPTKKAKTEVPMSQYEKEVKSYAGRSLKDDGIGVRPLVK
ncbi:hypothetical protein EW146_g2597 [Bondarzewia mesenterica]|uniref:Uncharacterized protein n=1 Tax=Bondarzewia mesenterica TaxID=1095465 RepID=A0A4S4M1M6_9AGAM|nr:hypothetical protein EW146_g2597 [Bondarzewia mesenterica]